jgi:multiple antibiotic resistance protein
VHARPALAWAVCVGGLIGAGVAAAAEAGAGAPATRLLPAAQIFTFLFLMLGPFKIIGPFAKITRGADAAVIRRIAVMATLFASLALLVAAMLGERILQSYGIPLPVLALSGGVILLLVALQTVLQQFVPHETHGDAAPPTAAAVPTLQVAMMPLAFPTIVTPYGIAALVAFIGLSPDLETRLVIGAIVCAIMGLNLIVMLVSRHMMPVLGVLLPILGAVLGVVQVALGLEITHNSLGAMGVL